MHQSLHVDVRQFHEKSEGGHRADHAVEALTDLVHHVLALQPVHHVPRRVVGPSLGHRTMLAQGPHLADTIVELGWFAAPQPVTDSPVYQQVGITPDRRGEMRVSLERESEMAVVLRGVNRLGE
jgi:hypothetical protein